MTNTLSNAVRYMLPDGDPDLVYRLAVEMFHHARLAQAEPATKRHGMEPVFFFVMLYGLAYAGLTLVLINL